MRRSVAWGVAAVVLSSAVVSVARAEVSPSAGSPLSRPEAALGSGSRQVPPLPAGSAPTVAAGVPVVGAAPAGFVAGRSVEVPAGRDVFETLYGNPDGSNTVVVSSEPVHYLADGRWEQINNRLVVDEDGSIRNAANAWSVRFGATLADDVSVTVGGESVSWSAAGAAPARAVVEPDGASVRYADAWPGVDLVYRVRGGAVEELLVLKRPDATSSFDFVLDALVRPVGSGLEVSKGSMRVGVAAPETFDAAGVVVDAVVGTRQQVTASDTAASVVRVGVDGRWLAGLAADRFPVTIDPTVTPSLPYLIAYPAPGQGYTQVQDGYARVGNPVVSGKPNLRWRSIAQFDYWSGVNNMLGKRVSNATVTLNAVSGSSSTAYGVTAFWADTFGFHDTVAPRVLPPPYPYGNSWTPDFGSASLGGAGSSASINVTSLYDFWTRSSMIGGTLLFRGNETAGLYTIKKFTVSLSITYVEAPAAPTLGAVTNPANGTRWLSVPAFLTTSQSSDPDTTAGDLRYRVEVGTDASFSSGVEYTSSWWPYYTFPPVGALFLRDQDFRFLDPGQGYWWRIAVTDGWYTVASTESRSFTWDPDPAVAPTDSQGPFTVNLATGLATTGVSTPSFESVGGPIGAEVAYSSHTKAAVGLVRQAWRDLNANGVVDAGDVRVERRVDATVDRDWASGGVTGDGVDNFLVQWSGVITAGAAGWQLGIECDQRAKVTIAGVTVIDKTASDCSAVANSGAIDWATGTLSTSPASLLVEFRETTGTARARVWIRQGTGAPQRVESSWFTPSGTKVLPAGWTFAGGPAALGWVHAQVDGDELRLTAADGTDTWWSRPAGSSTSAGWVEDDEGQGTARVGPDGSIIVSTATSSYVFNPDGTVRQVVDATDDRNTSAAAVHAYDGSGRLTSITDPVTGRQLRVVYQGQTGCSVSPIPTGFACAVQFALSGSDPSPETWTIFKYSSSNPATATLTDVVNFPDTGAPSNLDRNETWQFGYDGFGKIIAVRDPLAFDALRSGVRTDTAATTYDVVWGGSGWYWDWPAGVTMPAPTQGASRPGVSYTPTPNNQTRGFDRMDLTVAGTSPPAGYVARYEMDTYGRATTTRDPAGRASTVIYDSEDRITAVVDHLGRKTLTVYDPVNGRVTDTWGPAPAGDSCWTSLGATPACDGVAHEHVDYDLTAAGTPAQGLAATWWATTTLAPAGNEVRPALNTFGLIGTTAGSGTSVVDVDWSTGAPSGLVNAAGNPVSDGFSIELTGEVVFPTVGTYTLKLTADDTAKLYLDDVLKVDQSACCGPATGTFTTATVNERHQVRITYAEQTGAAKLRWSWIPPGGSDVTVPASALRPGYGYPTRTYTDGVGNALEIDTTAAVASWEYGQPLKTSSDGLDTTYTHTASWDRMSARALPDANTWTYSYWGDTDQLGVSVCGLATSTVQSGLLHRRVGPDPDGVGAAKRRVEEFAYDRYGHQIASRVGLEGASPGTLDAGVAWTCVTLDGRWRTTHTTYPAFGGAPARTVWSDQHRGGNPLVTEICDDNVTGSPVGTAGVCTGKTGVITTTVDLLGRTTTSTDVWSTTTTTGYDQAGRVTQRVGPAGTETFDYTADGRLWKHNLAGAALATLAYNPAGELTTITYANGTALADLAGVPEFEAIFGCPVGSSAWSQRCGGFSGSKCVGTRLVD